MDTAVLPRVELERQRSISLDLPKHPSSVGEGRRWLLGLFKEKPSLLAANRWDDAIVCISELITNALIHARTDCRVVVTWTSESLEIAVEDGATDYGPQVGAAEESAKTMSESGRGHVLLNRLADAWGFASRRGTGRKVVWATFESEKINVGQQQCVPNPR